MIYQVLNILPTESNYDKFKYQEYFEYQYTKGDVLKYFDIDMNQKLQNRNNFGQV